MNTQRIITEYNKLVLPKYKISRGTAQAKELARDRFRTRWAYRTALEIPAHLTKSGYVESIELFYWHKSTKTGVLQLRSLNPSTIRQRKDDL